MGHASLGCTVALKNNKLFFKLYKLLNNILLLNKNLSLYVIDTRVAFDRPTAKLPSDPVEPARPCLAESRARPQQHDLLPQ